MLAISAWIALRDGAREQALQFMRTAADGEDGSVKHVAMENRLYPFRELLGELLLEMADPTAALKEFETALKQTPNRYRAFLGIARAANAAGKHAKASEYYGKLVELTRNADTERQDIREAKEFLARK
jgi:Tfp pilus assembly protein PilF